MDRRKSIKHSPFIHQALFRGGESVRPRPELQETLPHHADMLRYDRGFCLPGDPSLVIFPAFRHRTDGDYPGLTLDRWRSYGIRLVPMMAHDFIPAHPVSDWITYQHPEGQQHGLTPVTLEAWLKAHPKVIIKGWHYVSEIAPSKYWAVTG